MKEYFTKRALPQKKKKNVALKNRSDLKLHRLYPPANVRATCQPSEMGQVPFLRDLMHFVKVETWVDRIALHPKYTLFFFLDDLAKIVWITKTIEEISGSFMKPTKRIHWNCSFLSYFLNLHLSALWELIWCGKINQLRYTSWEG